MISARMDLKGLEKQIDFRMREVKRAVAQAVEVGYTACLEAIPVDTGFARAGLYLSVDGFPSSHPSPPDIGRKRELDNLRMGGSPTHMQLGQPPGFAFEPPMDAVFSPLDGILALGVKTKIVTYTLSETDVPYVDVLVAFDALDAMLEDIAGDVIKSTVREMVG